MTKIRTADVVRVAAYTGIVGLLADCSIVAPAALIMEFETGWAEKVAAHAAGLGQNASGVLAGEEIKERPTLTRESIDTTIDGKYKGYQQKPDIIIHANDGTVLGEFYNLNEKATSVEKKLAWAIVAAEDNRFYDHFGFDVGATIRAVGQRVIGEGDTGGSTIPIQLADSLYDDRIYGAKFEKSGADGKGDGIPGRKKIAWKADEWLTAAIVEQVKTKDEILLDYMNLVTFGYSQRDGHEVVGVDAAAEYYFGKEPNELDYLEAATLASMIQNPSKAGVAYRAIIKNQDVEKSSGVAWLRGRTERVLQTMYELNFGREEVILPDREYQKAREQLERNDFGFKENRADRIDPRAYGFVTEVLQRTNTILEEQKTLIPSQSEIHVYTGLDLQLQEYAQTEMDKQCETLNKTLLDKKGNKRKKFENNAFNGAAVLLDTQSNDVLVMVDGCSLYTEVKGKNVRINYQNNRATESFWHPGSMIKGIIDMIAFMEGYTLDFALVDEKREYPGDNGNVYSPRNFGGRYSGKTYTITEATIDSVNSIFVELLFQIHTKIGEKKLVEDFQKFGYDIDDYKVPYGIGAFEASLTTIAGSYAVIANDGVATHYVYGTNEEYNDINVSYIGKIGIKNGDKEEVLFSVTGLEERVSSAEIAQQVQPILRGVVERGTGKNANKAGMDISGKTGTATANVGFVGYTKQDNLLAIVEFGLERPNISLSEFYIGGRHAAPIAGDLLEYGKNQRREQHD